MNKPFEGAFCILWIWKGITEALQRRKEDKKEENLCLLLQARKLKNPNFK